MHPDILRQIAADRIRELITQAGEARRAHEARHAQRRRLAAHLRRSTRPKNVWIVPDIPKTRSGKIMRWVIASVSNFADVGDITTLANPEIVDGIRQHVQQAKVAQGDVPRDLSETELAEIWSFGHES
jgi:acetyl-CoA synthetase